MVHRHAMAALLVFVWAGCGDDSRPPPADGGPRDALVGDAGDAGDASDASDAAPSSLAAPTNLEATGASEAVGLAWGLVPGATHYTLHWSTAPGVTPGAGESITNVAPGYIHRGLTDGASYHYIVVAEGPGGPSPPSMEAAATPGGEFELLRYGNGQVDTIASAPSSRVSLERRVHVLILAEGYLTTELAAGTFAADAGDWQEEVFALDPYSTFAEAFVVWALPRASAEHISATDPQTSDTAFRIPVTSSGDGVSSDVPLDGPTSSRVWEALREFQVPPTDFYEPEGRTAFVAKNLMVHILVLDPADGRSGLSGRARRLENPLDSTQRLSTAIAHSRAHEFSHAFARLKDEYVDVGHADYGADPALVGLSAYASNVVASTTCDDLPWRHLLVGGAINPDVDELVGAFGNATSGYHSELRCLMNGTHDNAMVFGGDGRLRSRDRFCNHCRELVVFRLFERVGILAEAATSLDEWASTYREPFYDRFGFQVPADVPQRSSDGTAWFAACTP